MRQKIRYAVVGLGNIAQVAMLPAFKNAKNSQLMALVSGDPLKLKKLSRKYKVPYVYKYEDFDECLASGLIDAVYISLPNSMHRAYAEAAASRGIHVLCEKPMAVNVDECTSMIETAKQSHVKFMIAYRLHFDRANLQAIEIAKSGKLGELRIFNSTFVTHITDKNNIRLKRDMGGGTLYDIGIYCINASRYLFKDEPIECMASTATTLHDPKFKEVEEMASCILRFPQNRLATFTCSFGAADESVYELIGTKGSLKLTSAYDYAAETEMEVKVDEKTRKFKYKKHDQFAPELVYFSDCILNDRDPEPSVIEGLNDVRIINALYESADSGQSVLIDNTPRRERPDLRQEIHRPGHAKPKTIHAPGADD